MNNARSADFAATTPWAGIQNRPTSFPAGPHAHSHGPGGNDPVSLAISQVVGLAQLLANKADLTVTINGYPLSSSPIVLKASDIAGVVDTDSPQVLYNKTLIGAIIERSLHLGILSTGSAGGGPFELSFATDEDLTADRSLSIDVADEDRRLSLRADFVVSSGGVSSTTLTISTNGADRLVELETDLSILTDGSGGGPLTLRSRTAPRTIDLNGNLTLAGGFDLSFSLSANSQITLPGNLAIVGAFDLSLTLTGSTDVTLPTSGTLANVSTVAAMIAAAVAAYQPLTGNSFTVAGLPSAAANVGRSVYCSNGASGLPCGAMSDGTNWKQIVLGANVTP